MKITKEHYAHLLTKIGELKPKIRSHREFLVQEGKAKDVEMRLRWDLLYAANLGQFVCGELYSYLNDTHIDTALKNIISELTN